MVHTGNSELFSLRRSVLSVPASNIRALAKLPNLDFDAVIFDLEDSVLPEAKAEARRQLIEFLKSNSLPGRQRVIRINDAGTDWFAEDIAAVVDARPDAVLVPKIHDPRNLQFVRDSLAESAAPDDLKLWAMMETPLAILNAAAIAEAAHSVRLDCMVVGLNDLRKETHVRAEPGRLDVRAWLMQVILAARAYGLCALDSVSNDFSNMIAFEQECIDGRTMGFDGKMLIHPSQIAAANLQFSPSEAEIAEAEAIIVAFERPEARGAGAINIAGRMVERLHLAQAMQLVGQAAAIKSRDMS